MSSHGNVIELRVPWHDDDDDDAADKPWTLSEIERFLSEQRDKRNARRRELYAEQFRRDLINTHRRALYAQRNAKRKVQR